MKLVSILTVVVLSLQSANSEELEELSVTCQNLGFYLLKANGDKVGISEEWHKDEREKVEELINKLVISGDLIEKSFKLEPLDKWTAQAADGIQNLLLDLGKKYGLFVAAELLDMGMDRRLYLAKEEAGLIMKVRLPVQDMRKFEIFIKINKLMLEKPRPKK